MNRAVLALLVAAASTARAGPGGSVIGSKHDLSVTGPGPVRALSEGSSCVFCHISHWAGEGRLSNRPTSRAQYQPYESSTMAARAGAPTGASRICLSCHDGTIAVGKTRTRDIAMTAAVIPTGRRSNLGTDLRRSHPISFRPAPGTRTRSPGPSDPVQLDGTGEVQCTSCHDPHREYNDPVAGMFLVKPNRYSALCLTCHDPNAVSPAGSVHATSSAAFGLAQGNEAEFSSVGEAGCSACHGSHGAEPRGRLVRKPPEDDDGACLRCHASGVTRVSLGPDVSKPYAHGEDGKGVHDAAEGPHATPRLPETSPGAPRHAACVDCHNPHAASARPAPGAPAAGGALAGVWGIDAAGQRVEQVQFEYELCFKCHGDSANKPRALGGVRRAAGDENLRRVFAPSSPSFHPVIGAGRSRDVPGLRPPYTSASLVYCTSCHGSDAGSGNGGTGPRGPHGSSYPALLERSYSTMDFTPESESSYALCYKCHDREVLLADVPAGRTDGTGFRKVRGTVATSLHRLHVTTHSAPCSACHAAHGVSGETGTPEANAHLVDLDLSIVTPGKSGGRRYRSYGARSGTCNLTCHAAVHAEGSPTSSY